MRVFVVGLLLFAAGIGVGVVSGRFTPAAPVPIAHPVHRSSIADGTPVSAPATPGPKIYYDAVHGARHLWNRDNRRYRADYHTVSGWYRFMAGLRTAGYEVVGEDYACFDRTTLDAYDVFMVGEETYHGRFMTDDEVDTLVDWVEDGGGLFVTVEHTNAHYMGDVFNRLTKRMPIQARFDSICDTETSHGSSRDWVSFPTIKPHPVTEGVEEYHFYNGCSLDTEHGVMLSSETSWSDHYAPKDKPVNNGNKKADEGEETGPLTGVAAFEFGKGRVVVIADHNALTNTEIYVGDHHRFGMNAIRWLAGEGPERVSWSYPDGYDLLVHTGAGSEFALEQKADTLSFRTAYGYWTKEPQLRPWAHDLLRTGDEAIVLAAPTKAYSAEELTTLDAALAAGEPVIWLATRNSLRSPVAAQLQEHFQFAVKTSKDPDLTISRPFEVVGSEAWTHGILRTFVDADTPSIHVEGLTPLVQLAWGSWHVEDVVRHGARVDLISVKDVGPGKLYVVAPAELFDDRHLRDLYVEGADVIRQQAAELFLRTVKIAVGDETNYSD
jgi:hypothetical protein